MSFKYSSIAYELLDGADINGSMVCDMLAAHGVTNIESKTVTVETGSTDFIKIVIPGYNGKRENGTAKTLGVVGRLGGVGARPEIVGLVSDADGAVATLALAMKLANMTKRGDRLSGDVILATHICPNAPVIKHTPVDFMGAAIPVEIENVNTVDSEMDAILSIDTTRGNCILNHRGFAITATVKNGYILRVNEQILSIMSAVSGLAPYVLPISMSDITPYGNGLYHINSIMQPAAAGNAPVIGVALTSSSVVPGCATGVSRVSDIEEVVRFAVEVGKKFGDGSLLFYDESEYEVLRAIYGFEGFCKK